MGCQSHLLSSVEIEPHQSFVDALSTFQLALFTFPRLLLSLLSPVSTSGFVFRVRSVTASLSAHLAIRMVGWLVGLSRNVVVFVLFVLKGWWLNGEVVFENKSRLDQQEN